MHAPMAIVLAAGKGKRMQSELPKVLCPALGRPLIDYVVDALQKSGVERIVAVVGYRADDVEAALAPRGLEFALQEEQLGTGHAVQMCASQIAEQQGPVVVLAGDSPMVQASSLQALLEQFAQQQPACLMGTLHKQNPAGLGRILREDGEFAGIVEEKDATEEQRQITEVNMSTYLFDPRELEFALAQLRNDNRQAEFYLTDCPGILRAAGRKVAAEPLLQPCEAMSVNTKEELQLVEDEMRQLGYGA